MCIEVLKFGTDVSSAKKSSAIFETGQEFSNRSASTTYSMAVPPS
jgi:hypothetical protein